MKNPLKAFVNDCKEHCGNISDLDSSLERCAEQALARMTGRTLTQTTYVEPVDVPCQSGTSQADDQDWEAAWEAGALGRAQDRLRARRNQLLAETDFYALSDVTMSDDMKTYRQELRDLPAGKDTVEKCDNATFPTNINKSAHEIFFTYFFFIGHRRSLALSKFTLSGQLFIGANL